MARHVLLSLFPTCTAVQYNNAMYLARYLLWFQCLQRPLAFAHLEEATGPDTPTRRAETAFYPSAWLSFALPLRALAQDCLLHHMRAQRQQTLEILNETGGTQTFHNVIIHVIMKLSIQISFYDCYEFFCKLSRFVHQVSRKFLTKLIVLVEHSIRSSNSGSLWAVSGVILFLLRSSSHLCFHCDCKYILYIYIYIFVCVSR